MFGVHFRVIALKTQSNQRKTPLKDDTLTPNGLLSVPLTLSFNFPRSVNPGTAGGLGHSTDISLPSGKLIKDYPITKNNLGQSLRTFDGQLIPW